MKYIEIKKDLVVEKLLNIIYRLYNSYYRWSLYYYIKAIIRQNVPLTLYFSNIDNGDLVCSFHFRDDGSIKISTNIEHSLDIILWALCKGVDIHKDLDVSITFDRTAFSAGVFVSEINNIDIEKAVKDNGRGNYA